MCWGDLITRDRSQPPNPENENTLAPETQKPISVQPHQHEILQVLPTAENLPAEESSSASISHNVNEEEPSLANLAMPYQSFRSTSDSTPSWRKELADKLRDKRLECRDQGDFILPMGSLNELIKAPVIERAIRDENPNMSKVDCSRHVERIENNAKKLFAIYALRPYGATLRFLLDTDLSDAHLPLRKQREETRWSLLRAGSQRRIEAFDDWDDIVDDFARPQWSTIAPFFDRNHLDCLKLEDERVLPFFSIPKPHNDDDSIPHAKVGGYGEVNAYRIHHEYHNFWPLDKSKPLESQPLIAVKELLHKDKIEFLKEKTILVALGHDPHPHLIQLLDANLRIYWAKNPTPHFTRDKVLWSLQQMAGISDGLDRIHCFRVIHNLNVEPHLYTPVSGRKYKLRKGEEKFGRHGDIKAENLLWFKDENVLKITDFGLGRFHGRHSRSRIDPGKVISPLTYEPPECTVGRAVSRRYDIWSMGCLFLELVTWLLEGNEKIGEFSDERGKLNPDSEVNDDNFFTAFDNDREPEVRDSVVQWVNGLHAHRKCSRVIHDLLDFVMDHMLRVDPDERIDASHLKERMKTMALNAEASEEYIIRPNPQLRTTATSI